MFFNKNFILKNILNNNPLFEYTAGDLKNASEPGRKSRAKELFTHFQRLAQGPDGQARTIWKVPSQTNRGLDYTVTLAIIVPNSTLFEVAKRKWDPKKFGDVFRGSDVKVHCTCPDFLFGGEKYNLGAGRYKGALEPKNTGYKGEMLIPGPAKTKDPGQNNILCKHAIAVADRLGANAFNIMKLAKGYTIEVKPNPELTKEAAPLKKDIEMVDLDKDRTDKIVNSIYRGVEEEAGPELEKNTTTQPEENKELVNDVVEPTDETPELSKDAASPEESKDIISDVTEEPETETAPSPVQTVSAPAIPKPVPEEVPSNEPKKLNSDLNTYDEKNELEKDKQSDAENTEQVEKILDKNDAEDKLKKDVI